MIIKGPIFCPHVWSCLALTATVCSSEIVWYHLRHHPTTPTWLMFSVNNLSPHGYRSALLFCFFDKNRATKATYWRRLLWLILQGIHSLSWGRQSSGQGRHGTGYSLASTLRKQRVNRGWGRHIVSQPAPSNPRIPARFHLLRVLQASQTSTPTGTKYSNI